jgi:MerR family transcriptional regulator, heat shock protein HspR
VGAESLDDEDRPAWTTGQAAEFLGVQPAFLRSLDAGQVLRPHRSAGGHRRWTSRQLALAARLRSLCDEGITLAVALRIVTLQDEVAVLTRQRDDVQDELTRAHEEIDRVYRELADVRREQTARAGQPGAPTAHPDDEVPTPALRPRRTR